MMEHFREHGLIPDYRMLIQTYEIGLTQRMINSGMRVVSLYGNEYRAHPKNPSFALVRELIEEGIPLIKKEDRIPQLSWTRILLGGQNEFRYGLPQVF
jgi:hypothetical protein